MLDIKFVDVGFDDYRKLVDASFEVDASVPVTLQLIAAELSKYGPSSPGGRAPFSLLFQGPSDVPLDQDTWRLVHPSTGPIDLFLVPISDSGGFRVYEAVFN